MLLFKLIIFIALFSSLCFGELDSQNSSENCCTTKRQSQPSLKDRLFDFLKLSIENIQQTILIQATNDASNPKKEKDFSYLVTGGYRPDGENELVKYLVSLRFKQKEKIIFGSGHYCGGSILSTTAVLTAAHCLAIQSGMYGRLHPKHIVVVAGTPQRMKRTDQTQQFDAKKIIFHREFTPLRAVNDVGIIKIKGKIVENAFAQVVPLMDSQPEPGLECTVLGWGSLLNGGLLPDVPVNADLTVLKEAYCLEKSPTSNTHICLANAADYFTSSCGGDSGGPLICAGKQGGIVSYGIGGCGLKDSPDFHTNVYYFRDWIEENSGCRYVVNFIGFSRIILIAFFISFPCF